MPSMYEIATNEIIPAIRSHLAKELINKHKLSEDTVAGLLGVAQSAVSKYMNGKYSDKVKEIEAKLNTKIIDDYIEKIAGGNKQYVNACICRLCQSVNAFNCDFSSAESVKV
ncbi:MAG: helix-turn-helix domain-containing protein [Candidatus Micrarchaeota archaeon]|nr:helix-turn-helix domain-containing protein [Candidatus Micrarchaeota archaeon]